MEEAMKYVLCATLILGWRPETMLMLDCISMMGLEERGEDRGPHDADLHRPAA